MEILYVIFCSLLWGYVCSLIAKKKGYNINWAWFWGIVGGLLAVIVYLLLGETEEKKKENIKKVLDDYEKSKEEKI